jgi:alpha-D-ribose 1-methylphosphonate 5-triphosphate synthase subunit PhnH
MSELPSAPLELADPIQSAHRNQRAFRSVMNALSRPGTFHGIDAWEAAPGLNHAATGVILALCDYETPIWFAPSFASRPELASWVAFQTDAPKAREANLAAFAVLDLERDTLSLASFSQGRAEYPDRSTTIIALTPSLENGPSLTITGPGIKTDTRLSVSGLPNSFRAQWAQNGQAFPLGVDVVFCSGTEIVALPRSTRIVEGDA